MDHLTEDDLIQDLDRLLDDGLVVLERDALNDDWPVRVRPTARGRAYALQGGTDGAAAFPFPIDRSVSGAFLGRVASSSEPRP
jgi:hypothetical protein